MRYYKLPYNLWVHWCIYGFHIFFVIYMILLPLQKMVGIQVAIMEAILLQVAILVDILIQVAILNCLINCGSSGAYVALYPLLFTWFFLPYRKWWV